MQIFLSIHYFSTELYNKINNLIRQDDITFIVADRHFDKDSSIIICLENCNPLANPFVKFKTPLCNIIYAYWYHSQHYNNTPSQLVFVPD